MACCTGLIDIASSFTERYIYIAFGELGIPEIANQMNFYNLHIFLGRNPSRKVYITRHCWSEVMALLKDKRVEVLYLEEKKRVNDVKRTWFKDFSWTTFFNTSAAQAIATVGTEAIVGEVEDTAGDR